MNSITTAESYTTDDSAHPAMIIGEDTQQGLIEGQKGFRYIWMFCIRSNKMSSENWLRTFFTSQVWLSILKIAVYGVMMLGWYTGKFSLFHEEPEKDLIVVIFLMLNLLMWLGILFVSILSINLLRIGEKGNKESIIFGTKAILYSNIFACLVNISLTVLQAVISKDRFDKKDRDNGELRVGLSIAFGTVSIVLLGQAYMFWHAEEPLEDYTSDDMTKSSYDVTETQEM